MKECPVLVAIDRSGKSHLIYCGKWSCPRCQKRLAKRWAIRTYKHLEKAAPFIYNGKPCVAVMITLTLPGKIKLSDNGYKMLPKLWNRLRMRMRRKYGDKWSYLAFVEGQQKTRGGMPHFHVISTQPLPISTSKRGYISKHKIHGYAVGCGFGFEADQKPVSDKGAAWYVSKYASKQDRSVPKGARRVRPSADWYKEDKAAHEPYFVPAYGEGTIEFIDRVASITGVCHEDIAGEYLAAQVSLLSERERLARAADMK